ncbi:MAG: cytochrome d ubiquinol oxidase subunit II [Bacteroidetes bacterium]|uniref:Cytochrome d ubiquinol oxidase subunit II n=2 Tax=Candidatus Merdivivens TaxID=2840533 RepID=A0A9D9J1C0_9BACT|nr:cytochrome d ubiquinol oxidase subunit II [Candidatus Merdivivens pullicola]MBO8481856.1 cytochrome d ubiquinol oxidase subunit II [Candidatus Merdivivens faecigallinarum]
MDTYVFLQHYWWAVVSLLGAILVFLLFVQGGNSLLFCIGKDDVGKQLLINSTGRKWEFTFTTLVTFGGAFFASFPLFYSTSFGGAYWLWMIILFTFVLQAVSYEFQSKMGNLLGRRTYRIFLVINGVVGPVLLGGAVATFFTGSSFIVDKGNLTELSMPVISSWANASHGLDALLNVWNVVFGLAVFFLARILGALYFINNIDSGEIVSSSRRVLKVETPVFLVFFLAFFIKILTGDGFAVSDDGTVFMEKYKYLHNFLEMPVVSAVFLAGVLLLLAGVVVDGYLGKNRLAGKGIFFSGFGTVAAVFALLLCAGYNGTAFYPSTADLQSSLTIANSCSSEFTLKTMAYVSILVPFVIAYIAYAWKAVNSKKLSAGELEKEEEKY